MEVRRLAGEVGAEIIGSNITSDGDWPEIRQVFIDDAAIVIRAQDISVDDHITFANR